MPKSSSSSSCFTPLADDQRPKCGATAVASPPLRAPRLPVHPGRPCVPAAPPYLSRHRARPGAPNPNRARGAAPDLQHRPSEEKGVKEEKEGGREAAAGEPFVAKTGAARGRSRTHRDRLLPLLPLPPRRRVAACLLFFLADQPPRRPSPTRSTSANGHRGEDAASSLLWTPRPSSQGGTPAAPRRRTAAGDAGHRARLGCDLVQVPPHSPTCAPPA
jgi:hypothetical protein